MRRYAKMWKMIPLAFLLLFFVAPARSGAPGPQSYLFAYMDDLRILRFIHHVGDRPRKSHLVPLSPDDWWCAPERFTLSESKLELIEPGKEKGGGGFSPFLVGIHTATITLKTREIILLPDEFVQWGADPEWRRKTKHTLRWTFTIATKEWYGRYQITKPPGVARYQVTFWRKNGKKREEYAVEKGRRYGKTVRYDDKGYPREIYYWDGSPVQGKEEYERRLAKGKAAP